MSKFFNKLLLLLLVAIAVKAQDSDTKLSLPIISNDSINAGNKTLKAGIASMLLPGAGQFYTGHYVKAGTFLALEGISGSIALHWYREEKKMDNNLRELRSFIAQANRDSSTFLLEESYLASHSKRVARYRKFNALSWFTTGYIYNVLDAAGGTLFANSEYKDPKKAALLAAIPGLGLGQLYNGKISKAGMVLMGQVSLGVVAINNHRLMKMAEDQLFTFKDPKNLEKQNVAYKTYEDQWQLKYQTSFQARNSYIWYSLVFYVVQILDAVVDAHLNDYDAKMKIYPDLSLQSGGALLKLNMNF
jgi:TM2 domain-containing membrane protein YozV